MRYEINKKKLLTDDNICPDNRKLFKDFLVYQEYKLKRMNNLSQLDAGCYKTLNSYLFRLKNVNSWFKNKPLKDVTKEDIKKVYDALEEGKIKTSKGKPFQDRKSYYNKIFRSKLFQMINKADLSREVMEFYKPNGDGQVRFVKEAEIKKIINVIIQPKQKLLAWLNFDIGENINSLLKLRKIDCARQLNELTREPEYLINLERGILKRSRTARTEPTNYVETVELLDLHLENLKDTDLLFDFKYGESVKFLTRAVKITGVRCIPKGQKVTWKDFRSSMACDLLKKGWTTDEVNARLGHKPSSAEIDKYITFLALDRKTSQKKVYDHNVNNLKIELQESKDRERLSAKRIESIQEQLKEHNELFEALRLDKLVKEKHSKKVIAE